MLYTNTESTLSFSRLGFGSSYHIPTTVGHSSIVFFRFYNGGDGAWFSGSPIFSVSALGVFRRPVGPLLLPGLQ